MTAAYPPETMIVDPLFYAAALPAVVLLGFAKGGFYGVGILALPLVSLVTPPLQALAIMLPILVVQDAITVWLYRAEWSGRVLAIMLPGAVVGIGAGYLFASIVPQAAIGLVIGLICVGFGGHRLWLERREPPPPRRGGVAGGLFWGAAAGFSSMIAQAGGPPYQVWVMPQRLSRDVLVGTSSIFFALLNLARVGPFMALGQLDRATFATSLALMPLAIAASFAGVALVRRVPVERLYRALYALLILVGAKLLYDGIVELSGELSRL